ncbi:MAG: recombinase family protein [Anaerocolumna sp.]
MRIAIYSRKSKWTGKGESIENQLTMCRNYIKSKFPDVKSEDIYEYEDEGFSGKNVQRPQFQKMMKDLNDEQYDYLICYKLDRLGRNLLDLVNLIDEINKLGTSFISIKENFDTYTSMGRAMLFITGVLAQMEREQIAERVRDNMIMLARSGRWLGGTTPLGFYSKKDEKITVDNKVRTSYRLTVNEKEMGMVRFIFNEFLEKQSLSQLDKYFSQNGIKTKNGNEYQISTIRDILTNPVYCVADKESYDYFVQIGCQVCFEENEVENGYGLMSYGKTSSAMYKNKKNEPSEWIIAIAKHKGIINGCEWVKVQQILEINKKRGESFRKVQNPVSLLSGILYCKCGSPMRPKNYPANRLDEEGNRTYAYICSRKEKSNRLQCDVANIHGNTLDRLVCNEVLAYTKPDSAVYTGLQKLRENLSSNQNGKVSEIDVLKDTLEEKKKEIKKLVHSFSKLGDDDALLQYIKEQVEELDKECKRLEEKIHSISLSKKDTGNEKKQVEIIEEQISSFSNLFETLSVQEKREYLRMILENVVWDGDNAHIFIYGGH